MIKIGENGLLSRRTGAASTELRCYLIAFEDPAKVTPTERSMALTKEEAVAIAKNMDAINDAIHQVT